MGSNHNQLLTGIPMIIEPLPNAIAQNESFDAKIKSLSSAITEILKEDGLAIVYPRLSNCLLQLQDAIEHIGDFEEFEDEEDEE